MEEKIQLEEVDVACQAQTKQENNALLNAYKWQTTPEGHTDMQGPTGAATRGSRKWSTLQSWKRSRSHPSTNTKGADASSLTPAGTMKLEATAVAKRSVFRRAFSNPAKEVKEPGHAQDTEDTGRGDRLRNYFRSVSQRLLKKSVASLGPAHQEALADKPEVVHCMPLTPSPEVNVWDISNFTLLDGQLILTNRDEENTHRTRNRTGSCLSGSSLQHACCLEEVETASTLKTLNGPRFSRESLDQESIYVNQPNNVKGLLLKRTKRKKPPSKLDLSAISLSDGERCHSMHSSHDSLTTPLSTVEMLDLSTEKDVVIRPLHSSILGEKFCFEIITSEGSRCFACTSVEERDRWIENLRRIVQPNKDNCERVENTLSLWIYEAKDILPKRKYFCELHLDGTLYARTTSKLNQGTIFWGEHFEFENLPPVSVVAIHLLQEDEKKKKKEHRELVPAGSVSIKLSDLVSRQHVEKWFPVCKAAPNKEKLMAPSIRVKGRYQNMRVLPIVQYKEFAEYIAFNYMELCTELEPAISVKDKEELASSLVHVLQCTGKAKSFLIDLGIAELDRFDVKESLIFRENTLTTKAIDEYMKLVGQKYLLSTLGEFIVQLYDSEDSCEVDPSKCPSNDLSDNQNNLRQSCEEVFRKITDSCDSFPAELNEIFATWQEECFYRQKVGIGQRLICASLFLRFLCPAIMSPSLFHLTQEYPSSNTSRTLTLVAKVIQNLANFTRFGDKEAYMGFMNEFLEHNEENMKMFLQTISSQDSEMQMSTYDGYIDLATQLSVLHSLLFSIFITIDQQTKNRLEPLPTILQAIQEGTPVPSGICTNPDGLGSQENEKPGFLAPRDLPKHSPLVTKSTSMMSIQKNKGREEERAFHGLVASQSFTKTKRHIHRTQSVPAGNRDHRMQKRSSTEHLPKLLQKEGAVKMTCLHISPPGGVSMPQGRSRVQQSASLPRRKSMVPWLRSCEGTGQANKEMDYCWPSERYMKRITELQKELQMTKERQQSLEARVEEMMGQLVALHELQDSEQRLTDSPKQKENHPEQRHSRCASAEEKKRAQPRETPPIDTERRIIGLEARLSILEREYTLMLARVNHPDEITETMNHALPNRMERSTFEVRENGNGSLSI
ncbi:RAS protein activator like-3 isoform X2 [Pleurodeles waltl]|uniref:RAS protein activator like-3 isoform X2 n=1 Tax=Pleurodeles waltl TaxID=8319 RepID=UPI00370966B6